MMSSADVKVYVKKDAPMIDVSFPRGARSMVIVSESEDDDAPPQPQGAAVVTEKKWWDVPAAIQYAVAPLWNPSTSQLLRMETTLLNESDWEEKLVPWKTVNTFAEFNYSLKPLAPPAGVVVAGDDKEKKKGGLGAKTLALFPDAAILVTSAPNPNECFRVFDTFVLAKRVASKTATTDEAHKAAVKVRDMARLWLNQARPRRISSRSRRSVERLTVDDADKDERLTETASMVAKLPLAKAPAVAPAAAAAAKATAPATAKAAADAAKEDALLLLFLAKAP